MYIRMEPNHLADREANRHSAYNRTADLEDSSEDDAMEDQRQRLDRKVAS